MNNIKLMALLTISLAITAISGCGGGGSGDATTPTNPPPVGGIGRNGVAVGPITTFGSVVVNGVRYDTSSANFTVNGLPGSQDDLSVGQVITVSGTIDDNGVDGDADEVNFDDNVKGPVQSINTATSQIVVLGQTVLINPETSFDDSISPASINGLDIDDIVEVSGLVDATGRITATRIELKPAGTEFEVLGIVSGHDMGNFLFNINNLVVDYSGATLDNFSAISDGDFVEAKGMSLNIDGELEATTVELKNALPDVADGVHVEIQGFITRFDSLTDFDVTGLPVTTTASTVYEGGVEGDLGPNIKVEVEGDVNSSGVLVATKVDIRRAKAVRATANVDSVDAEAGSLVMLGITVSVDALTRLEDKSDVDMRPLTLANINADDYVEVRGSEFPAGSGNILATILERDDVDLSDPDPTILQGFVEDPITNSSFTILGVSIETGAGTIFRDVNDAVIPSTEFFNQLAIAPNPPLVKAKGSEISGTVISATEVEFELEI